jgi:hypothetical protein
MGEKVRGAAVRQTDRSRKKEVQVERWMIWLNQIFNPEQKSPRRSRKTDRQIDRQTDRQK